MASALTMSPLVPPPPPPAPPRIDQRRRQQAGQRNQRKNDRDNVHKRSGCQNMESGLQRAFKHPEVQPHQSEELLCDLARVAALLDIRQFLGANKTAQIRLTFVLMDHDLSEDKCDYLVPSPDSDAWFELGVDDQVVEVIRERIRRIPQERMMHNVRWNANKTEVLVGERHRVKVERRDVQALKERWVGPSAGNESLEIARLLALYRIFDEPYSAHRNGVHLGLAPAIRRSCDYELFASPLNAVVPNGNFASKWPHIEWRFGSMGSYPSVLDCLPYNSCVEINPPYTDTYMDNFIYHLPDLRSRFQLRFVIPKGWIPDHMYYNFPGIRDHDEFYDASTERRALNRHSALYWEDPRLADRESNGRQPWRRSATLGIAGSDLQDTVVNVEDACSGEPAVTGAIGTVAPTVTGVSMPFPCMLPLILPTQPALPQQLPPQLPPQLLQQQLLHHQLLEPMPPLQPPAMTGILGVDLVQRSCVA